MTNEIHKILIGGTWREARNASETFTAINPATEEPIPGEYPVSTWQDVEAALEAGAEAAAGIAASGPEAIAVFLETFAREAEARKEEIAAMAHAETGLPVEPRLRSVEFPRMTDQLRQAAAACRDRSWCRATIDTKLDIRSKYSPLGGPVVVLSPNNFPLAFNSVGGGDFAAAIAAGNPVLAKANPGHPGTTRILAEAAFEAVARTGLPSGTVQLLYHFRSEDGLRLVAHPLTGATAFTGSRTAGLKLKEAADKAGKPIYLEMSSVNPVFVLPGAIEERGAEIAADLSASCLLGAGQFCTKPGLVVLAGSEAGGRFLQGLKESFEKAPPGILLNRGVAAGLEEAVSRLRSSAASLLTGGGRPEGPGFRYSPTLFRVTGRDFLRDPALYQIEAFGTLTVAVVAEDVQEMTAVASRLEGQLTAAVYSHRDGEDDAAYGELEPLLRRKAGRLLNDKMPTGIAVSPAMAHGGPFPATGHPGFTSVGIPASILRFAALRCYDKVRPNRLPPQLRDENPTGRMWRLVDGEWTQ